jgi:serine/threonine protein kinase
VLALDHLHQSGIVYRDLKSENVLIDVDGQVRLVDFGLAREIGEESADTFCGTHHYLAPEIVARRKYSYPVDWWALGLLLCEMLTGELPFRAGGPNGDENCALLFSQIYGDRPTIAAELKGPGRELIEQLLTKDVERRIGFEEVVAHPWFDGMDWEIVAKKGYEPGWKPALDSNGICQANFDPMALEEPLVDSPVEAAAEALQIDNFSSVAPWGIGDQGDDGPGSPLVVPDDG